MRIATSCLAALLWTGGQVFAQVPNAGPDQTLLFPNPVILAGSVQGGTPLSWWTADGNGAFENYLMKYHDQIGVTPVGPLRLASGGTFGYPTDFARVGSTIYGIDGLRRYIYILDPATGIVTPIGSAWSAQYPDLESLAYDMAGDRLFAVDRTTGQLLRIDRSNGALTLVGTTTLAAFGQVRSLAWRASNGRLYAVDQATHAVLSIDPTTGAATIVSHVATEPHARIEELEFVGDRMYGVNAIDDGTTLVAGQLQRIIPEQGLGHNIGPVINQVSALCLLINSLPEDHVWSKGTGPGTVSFSDPYALNTTVTFSQPGTYVLRLRVNTISGPVYDTVTIVESEWSVFTASADTRAVYVSSSSGNDANNGLSSTTPKRTIAAGKALLRNGFPDWLLLKKGDAWDEALGDWRLSGRSLAERMLLSSYGAGTARPLLRTGIGNGFNVWDGVQSNNLAIVGLHFWANLYTGSQGLPRAVQLFGAVRNFLLEDCYLQAYETNLVVQGASEWPAATGRHINVMIRRNVIVDAYNTGGSNSQGIFASGTDGLFLEENVWDHNGWRNDVPGSWPTWYRRNIYIQNLCTGVVVRGNIIAGTDGIQQRSGGICEDNLFLHNAISIAFGLGGYPAIEADGVTGTIRRNVVLDGGDLQPGSERGWGMWLGNIRQSTIDSNVIAHNVSGHGPSPVTFEVAVNGRSVENTVFSNNIVYAWNGYSRFKGDAAQTVNVQLLGNKFQNEFTPEILIQHDQANSANPISVVSANNVFDSIAAPNAWFQAGAILSLAQWKARVNDTTSVAQSVPFPDPTRTVATYQASIGGIPTLQSFLGEARKQSKSFWRIQHTAKAVNDYIRSGFGL